MCTEDAVATQFYRHLKSAISVCIHDNILLQEPISDCQTACLELY